jgi:hypothetical protein
VEVFVTKSTKTLAIVLMIVVMLVRATISSVSTTITTLSTHIRILYLPIRTIFPLLIILQLSHHALQPLHLLLQPRSSPSFLQHLHPQFRHLHLPNLNLAPHLLFNPSQSLFPFPVLILQTLKLPKLPLIHLNKQSAFSFQRHVLILEFDVLLQELCDSLC